MTSHPFPSRRAAPTGPAGPTGAAVPTGRTSPTHPAVAHPEQFDPQHVGSGPQTGAISPARALLFALLRGLGGGLIVCILAAAIFAATGNGLGLRANDRIVPTDAPSWCLAMLAGLACTAPILPFSRGLRTARPLPVLTDTLLIGILAATTAVLCRLTGDLSSTTGTVWSDLGAGAPAFIAVAALTWAAANLGFTIFSLAEAARAKTLASLGVLVLFVALTAGITVLGGAVESGPTDPVTALSVAGAVLTALLFTAVRRATAHNRTGPKYAAAQSHTARRTAPTAARPTGHAATAALFHPGEIEYAHLRSRPPFDADHLILTDLRIMRVRTDAAGSIVQLSQAAPWQIESARRAPGRDRATVIVELHIGSSMRLEATNPAEAQHFVDTLTEVVARSRAR